MLIQEMTDQDSLDLLTQARFGRLGCAHDNQPYVVPIYYACSGRILYGFATFGQKIRWMRANPLVCVEADEIDRHLGWKTVIAFGRYEEMSDFPEWEPEREHARALLEGCDLWWVPAAITSTHRGGSYDVWFRIHVDRLTGFRAIPHPTAIYSAISPPVRFGSAHRWFERLIQRRQHRR